MMIDLTQTKTAVNDAINAYHLKVGKYQQLSQHLKDRQTKLDSNKNTINTWKKCVALINQCLPAEREKVTKCIENLVTSALQASGYEDYSFKMKTIQKETKSELMFVLIKQIDSIEVEIELAYGTCGGGILNIVAIALKLIVKILFKNVNEAPLILDESFGDLSKDKSKNLIKFISDVSKKFGIQVILITHDPNITLIDEKTRPLIDKLYHISLEHGVSKIESI